MIVPVKKEQTERAHDIEEEDTEAEVDAGANGLLELVVACHNVLARLNGISIHGIDQLGLLGDVCREDGLEPGYLDHLALCCTHFVCLGSKGC